MIKELNDPWINLENVLIQHIGDLEMLESLLNFHLEVLISSQNIKIIVIDSISCLFRVDESSKLQQSQILLALTSKLKFLSEKYSLLIVCINQVSDNFYSNQRCIDIQNYCSMPFYELGREHAINKFVPCLGISWFATINTRLIFTKNRHDFTKRTLFLVKSPWTLSKYTNVKIDNKGFVKC